jgi:N-acetylglucosaminyl-diphospho-decaprenol L-rhamnosyltransferase
MNGIAAQIVAVGPVTPSDLLPVDLSPPRRTVSVVMVVYMTGEALEQSLGCVLADDLIDELVLVDNGSRPAETQRLRALAERDSRVVLLAGHGNVGFARGANLGAQRAGGDILVFLNPDAFLQRGCVGELVREIDRNPGLCLVGGRVLNADRSEQRGARRGEITPMSALMSLSTLARLIPGWRHYEVHWEADAAPDQVVAVPTISGACFAMRRGDFTHLGGFDERYFLHVEDVDLCWRVRAEGGQVRFHPRAEVIHLGHTSQVSPLKVEFHKGVGLARFFRKRASGLGQKLTAWLLTPLVISAAVARPAMWRMRGG